MEPSKQRRTHSASNQGSAIKDAAFYSNYGTANNTTNSKYLLHRQANDDNNGVQPPYHSYPDRGHGPKLGLIRGYHRQMYEPVPQKGTCCECSTGETRGATSSHGCNWGVAFGCVLLIIGVIAILMGFMVPQKSSKRHGHLSHEEKQELHQINLFIDIFVISGLSVLSIGGLLISVALLLPLLRRRAERRYDEPIRYFGSEVYVKSEDLPTKLSENPSIDLGFHKDVVPADIAVRKIQPESEKSEPVDLTTQSK